MADTLGLLKGGKDSGFYSSYFICRDDYQHSGNWSRLNSVFKGMREDHRFAKDYYGDRLMDHVRLAPINVLMRW
jgi:hypothetical protein